MEEGLKEKSWPVVALNSQFEDRDPVQLLGAPHGDVASVKKAQDPQVSEAGHEKEFQGLNTGEEGVQRWEGAPV